MDVDFQYQKHTRRKKAHTWILWMIYYIFWSRELHFTRNKLQFYDLFIITLFSFSIFKIFLFNFCTKFHFFVWFFFLISRTIFTTFFLFFCFIILFIIRQTFPILSTCCLGGVSKTTESFLNYARHLDDRSSIWTAEKQTRN